jgi:ATP-dependent Clp protease ATP-binding subunit ClpC
MDVGAEREAQRLYHPYIGTEHVLLGLVAVEAGQARAVLRELGAEPDRVRLAVESILGQGDQPVTGSLPLTPRAKRTIELSVAEARRLRQNHIGTEHLLLGLVAEGEGMAAGVLLSLGIELEAVRTAVRHHRDASAA